MTTTMKMGRGKAFPSEVYAQAAVVHADTTSVIGKGKAVSVAKATPPAPEHEPISLEEATSFLSEAKKVFDAAGADLYLSIRELDAALKAPNLTDAMLDDFLAAELARAGGPRKVAMQYILAAEQKREGGPRVDVIELIQGT